LNQTAKLFEKAPDLLAVWEHYVLSDEKVRRLREQGKFKEAWIEVADGIMSANHGDCHAHQRKRKATRSYMHTLHQSGDRTVREVATAIMEETKARDVLGVFDGIRTLLKHVIADGKACEQGANYGVTMFGLNLTRGYYGEHREIHANIVRTLLKWADTQTMYTLYGSLRPALQTHVEDAEQREHGHRLMPKPGERVTTFEELKTSAAQCESRENNRMKDMAAGLKSLGLDVPKDPKKRHNSNQQKTDERGKQPAWARWMDGKGKGKGKGKGGGKGGNRGGKGKGGGGKGGNRWAAEEPPSEADCVAGKDGELHPHVQCYACWKWGHTKSKYQVWNCPTIEDPWAKPDTGGPPAAPKAVVEQVAPPVAAALDINALFDAVAMNESGADDPTVAMMKEIYSKSAKVTMIRLTPKPMCVVQSSMGQGKAPAGQNFTAYVGMDAKKGPTAETIFDDGGSPVNLIGPEKAKKLMGLGLARKVQGMSLHEHFTGVVSATGHDLGYQGDLQINLYPVDKHGHPSAAAYPILAHIVNEYQGDGILIGTQQHQEWGLVTSYLTGMKTITLNSTEHSYPFSVSKDGTLVCPALERRKPSWAASHSVDGLDLQSSQDLQSCIAEAAQVVAYGVPGAFGSAWMESTPSVPLADNSVELQHHKQLKEELLKAANAVANGGPAKEAVIKNLHGIAGPRSKVKKKVQISEPPDSGRALSKWASFTLLAASVWAAALTLTTGGVVPTWPHSWDHAAPQSRKFEKSVTQPPWGSGTTQQVDLSGPAATEQQDHGADNPAEPLQVGTWAEWQCDDPLDFDGRACTPFSLEEVQAAVGAVQTHPMFDSAVVRQINASTSCCAPPDVAALVWSELKLDNNPKMADDATLRTKALKMIEDAVMAFHKPDPLLRPILNKDKTELEVHVHTKDERPLTSRMYRVSPDRLPAMRDKLNEMLAQGVIRRSHSSWSSPLVFVPKPPGADGKPKWRCTVDMRQLNKKTVPYKYPTPHIDDLILACGYTEPELKVNGKPAHVAEDFVRVTNGVTYTGPHRPRVWDHCDFFESFHEVKVAEGSRHKFAFQSPTHGLCEYMRLPMGWINSPSILQAVVQDICREIYDGPGRHHGKPALGNFVWNYLDDCAIVAANDEEATHQYRWLFTKFAERGLTVRASKSGLYLKQITFVGHICDEHGVHADPKKVEAIRKLAVPTDAGGVRRLL
jgi:hypothetical protein